MQEKKEIQRERNKLTEKKEVKEERKKDWRFAKSVYFHYSPKAVFQNDRRTYKQ